VNGNRINGNCLRFSELAESRENNFDFLRLLLAVIVLQYHSFPCAGSTTHSFKERLMTFQIGGGWIAVNFFFVISGFLITSSWLRSAGLADYLRKRFLRIYPGLFVAMLFCAFLIGPLTGASLPGYFSEFRTYLYFKPLILGPVEPLPGVLAQVPWKRVVNGSLWTIRFEIFCYLFLAALGLCGLLRRRICMLVVLAIAIIASRSVARDWPHPWKLEVAYLGSLWEAPRFLSYFMAGVCFYLWRDHILSSRVLALCALALLCAGYAFGLEAAMLPLCGSYLVFFVAFNQRLPMQRVGAYGDFSYGVYLYAFPVQQLLVYWLAVARHPLVLTAMALPITLLLSLASWKLVEQPFLRRKKRSASHGVAAPAMISPDPVAAGGG
jgi:peptidoglycan/LPS O-acetylase OafA/YrhL